MNDFVIILNFFREDNTVNCIKSVCTSNPKLKIIVIDNGSPCDFGEFLKRRFPNLFYIKSSNNVGFAAGNNIGIKYAIKRGAESIILLNNDTIVLDDNLENLINSDGDIVGAVIKYKRNNKNYYDLGGYINWNIGRTYHKEVNSVSQVVKGNPDYVSGAVMLIRKKVVDKIGFFDEKYFLYYEDVDYCVRASKAGFKIMSDTDTIIYHKLGATLGRKSFFTFYHNLRSNLIFIFKHISLSRKPFALMYWILLCAKVILNWFLRK